MWGNTLGWILSAAITALAVVLAVILWQAGQPTPPTAFMATAMMPLGTITADATAAGLDGTDPAINAGALYRRAINDCSTDERRHAYEALSKNNDTASAISAAEELKGVDLIAAGAKGGSMDLYKSKPREIANYLPTVDSLDDLELIGKAALSVARAKQSAGDKPGALALAKAVEVLGYNLYKERITYDELKVGESLLGEGGATVGAFAEADNDAAAATGQKKLDADRIKEFKSTIDPVSKVIHTFGDQSPDDSDGTPNAENHAGDYYAMAVNPKVDRVWRVEAIRRIGRLIFNAKQKADQTRAPKFLAKLANDTSEDSVIRAAADTARHIDSKGNQAMR
jgi:hypothetical protein